MATITARGTLILQHASNVANSEYITDASDTSYGTITVAYNSSKDIVIGGFDFSAIPDGSTINSFSLKSLCGLDAKMSCEMYATRYYNNGSFNNVGVTSRKAFGSAETLVVNTISETAPFTVFAGISAEDINQKWTNASDYTGIAFYLRYVNSGYFLTGSKNAYPRYFYLAVDYTPPPFDVTVSASPIEGGTVTGGGTYESGSDVTLTAVPNNGYVFSHWYVYDDEGNTTTISVADYTLPNMTENFYCTAFFEKEQRSKIRYGTETAKSVFDTQKNKAKSVWYGNTQIL